MLSFCISSSLDPIHLHYLARMKRACKTMGHTPRACKTISCIPRTCEVIALLIWGRLVQEGRCMAMSWCTCKSTGRLLDTLGVPLVLVLFAVETCWDHWHCWNQFGWFERGSDWWSCDVVVNLLVGFLIQYVREFHWYVLVVTWYRAMKGGRGADYSDHLYAPKEEWVGTYYWQCAHSALGCWFRVHVGGVQFRVLVGEE